MAPVIRIRKIHRPSCIALAGLGLLMRPEP
jgi:hypothetical protein